MTMYCPCGFSVTPSSSGPGLGPCPKCGKFEWASFNGLVTTPPPAPSVPVVEGEADAALRPALEQVLRGRSRGGQGWGFNADMHEEEVVTAILANAEVRAALTRRAAPLDEAWPDRAWLISHWVGHRCEMADCRTTTPHEHGGGQPMRSMTPEELAARLPVSEDQT